MSLKNIISTIVVSMVAVSMIACDSKSSKKGSKNTPANVSAQADNSLESQLEKVNAEIKELKSQKLKIETANVEDPLLLEDAENAFDKAIEGRKNALDQLRVAQTAYKAATEQDELDALNIKINELSATVDKHYEDMNTTGDAIHNLRESMKEDRKEVSKINLKIEDKELVKESLELKIDLEVVKNSDDYKNGHPRTQSSYDRKVKRIEEINMKRNVMFSGADYL